MWMGLQWKYDKQVKTFNYSKKAVGDIVRGKKAVLETIFSEFAIIAHHKRLLEQRSPLSLSRPSPLEGTGRSLVLQGRLPVHGVAQGHARRPPQALHLRVLRCSSRSPVRSPGLPRPTRFATPSSSSDLRWRRTCIPTATSGSWIPSRPASRTTPASPMSSSRFPLSHLPLRCTKS